MKKLSLLSVLVSVLFLGVGSANAQGVNLDVKANVELDGSTSNTKSKNEVSATAREVKGWDDSKKTDFLKTVKVEAELKSEQDLDNFAKGAMLKDENLGNVEASDDSVEVRYKLPAKFLGVFGSSISSVTNVSFESNKQGRGPKEVTVKFPWSRMFFSLDDSVKEETLEKVIDASVQINAQTPRDNAFSQNAVTINLISNILKGVRADLDASATATVN